MILRLKGGTGSGNFGHAGRPGMLGGSGKGKFAGKKANIAGKDTLSQYQYPDGSWTVERQALHNKIIASFFVGKTPVDNPTSYVLGGAGAVGKSTFIGSGGIPDSLNAVTADSDTIKFMLPEFELHVAGNETFNPAVFTHEESAYLSKKIAAKAASEGYNVILDGTGDSAIESLAAKVNALRSRGQKVNGVYLTCDVETALARSASRFARTGRIVPKALFLGTHARISRVFPDIVKANLYDKIDLYDTSSGRAELIATGNMHKFTIINKPAYQAFLDKAKP